jgi:hypothetical protein
MMEGDCVGSMITVRVDVAVLPALSAADVNVRSNFSVNC